MLKKFLLKVVFNFLNQKVLTIAHPQLRQFAKQIVSDCEAFAELMLANDLTDAATAQTVFEAQLPTARTFLPIEPPFKVPYDRADVPKGFDDRPKRRPVGKK